MAEVVLFHHALGLTKGMYAFADKLEAEGHTVHVPDLFEGRLFTTIESGMAYVREAGVEAIIARGERAAAALPREIVYAGFSLGVLPAQSLSQTREGARGALFFDACVPPSAFGSPWPADMPVQIHGMDADPFFAHEGDLEAARELAKVAQHAELYVYPGDRHLFADSSLSSTYDTDSAALLLHRVLEFLRRLNCGDVRV